MPKVCRIRPQAERCWVPRGHRDLPRPRGPPTPFGEGEATCRGGVPAVPSVPTPAGSHLLRSSAGLSRGSDADLPLLVGATLGVTLPRAGGLGSLRRGQSHCHHPDPSVSPQASP